MHSTHRICCVETQSSLDKETGEEYTNLIWLIKSREHGPMGHVPVENNRKGFIPLLRNSSQTHLLDVFLRINHITSLTFDLFASSSRGC